MPDVPLSILFSLFYVISQQFYWNVLLSLPSSIWRSRGSERLNNFPCDHHGTVSFWVKADSEQQAHNLKSKTESLKWIRTLRPAVSQLRQILSIETWETPWSSGCSPASKPQFRSFWPQCTRRFPSLALAHSCGLILSSWKPSLVSRWGSPPVLGISLASWQARLLV